MLDFIGSLLKFFSPWSDEFYQKRVRDNQAKQELYRIVLDRIHRERPNFERLLGGDTGYNSVQHKKAVDADSFDLLEKDTVRLRRISKFKSKAERILNYIRSKDVRNLLSELISAEKMLQKELPPQY